MNQSVVHSTQTSSSETEVLSKSGEFAVGAEAREVLCYLSDGRLLVAAGQTNNPYVVSYKFRLSRMGKEVVLEETELANIKRYYAEGAGSTEGAVDHTKMQQDAKQLLEHACKHKASDIHIRVQKYSTEVYFRIFSDMRKILEYSREYGERLLATLYGAMADVSDSAYKPSERQDARIGGADKLPDGLHGVRIATSPTVEGSLMVMRLLYSDTGGDTDLLHLGFNEDQSKLLQAMSDQPIGMNIISGPTGSGKSTTLQRILTRQIAQSLGRTHIITVEDPPEYPIVGAVQTPVSNAGTAELRSTIFTSAISNAMRLDPDTIMVGEVRDMASAQMVLRASMTGHQVWTTVHANNAIAVLDRLVDLGLPINMVADHFVLSGLMSQRLCKTLCQHCSKPLSDASVRVTLSLELTRRLDIALDHDWGQARTMGDGCDHCSGRGTSGRTVVAEVLRPNGKFYEYIRAGEKTLAREYWIKEMGGLSMVHHVLEKIKAGLVDPAMAESAVGYLYNPLK